ncbi:MAG: guanylate kinase [Dehalococcoidia bacterium]|nr:guanylate kinase [Dehalococcoidia bacterium]
MTNRSVDSKSDGRLFVLSGPSGVGKDALLSVMKQQREDFYFTTTATTRPKRPGERDDVDYLFMARGEFQRMIDEDGLLEWAEVYGNLYGVPKSQVTDALEAGRNVLLKVDVQGAATVKRLYSDAVLIFLEPPSMESLDRRLTDRGTEQGEALRIKLETAREEMKAADWFDHRVVNHDGRLDEAVSDIARIVAQETTPK